MAPVGSQQFWAQGPGPARRCGTEGITGLQGRERGIGGGNEDGSRHEDRDGYENKSKDEDEKREEGGGERESGNPRRGIEVGQKTSEGGRHQQVTRSHSDKTRRPSEAVASC